MEELLKKLEEQAKAFHEFKSANEARIAALEKGRSTSDHEAKLAKVETDLGKIANEIQELSAKAQRAQAGGVILDKNGNPIRQKSAEEIEYEGALQVYMRKGKAAGDAIGKLMEIGEKTLQVNNDPDGGFWVSPDQSGRLVQKVYETSPVRQIASVVTISTDALEGPIDNQEAAAGWVSETGARTASGTPKTGKWRIPVHEMYAMPEATQQLLDDAAFPVESWLNDKVTDYMVRLENTAFVTGNGVGKPRGFTDYTTAATADSARAWGQLEHLVTGTSAGFGTDPNGADKLIELVHKLKAAYRQGSAWVMSRSTLGLARRLKDGNGQYLWLPSMTAGQNSTLLGYPVVEMEDMPAVAANSLSIAFGNFKVGYQIVDRQGFRLLRDPFTNKPYIRFYTTRRVGGDVLNFEAIKFLKFST